MSDRRESDEELKAAFIAKHGVTLCPPVGQIPPKEDRSHHWGEGGYHGRKHTGAFSSSTTRTRRKSKIELPPRVR